MPTLLTHFIPVSSSSKRVGDGIVRVELYSPAAIPHTGLRCRGRQLQEAGPTLGEHRGRVVVQFDGFGEQSDSFVPFILWRYTR